MKRVHPIFSIFILLLMTVPHTDAQEGVAAQPKLTLPQAIDRALENHPAVAIQRSAVNRALGRKSIAGLVPNPTLTYYREDLALNGAEVGEWILTGSLPLNFLWTRWSKLAAAEKEVEAEEQLAVEVARQLRFAVQRAFVETHFAEKAVETWQRVTAVLDRAAKAAHDRFVDGDLSGYEQQRIAFEQLHYRKAMADASVELSRSRRLLAFLVDSEVAPLDLQTSDDFLAYRPDIIDQAAVEAAVQSRPDFQAAQVTLGRMQAALTANKWQALPDVTTSLGYKEQLDHFRGSVFQVNVSVPIFDRNQGQIRSARAAVQQQQLTTQLLEKEITREIKQARQDYEIYRGQVEQLLLSGQEVPDEFLETAVFSYGEGEMSLLELTDGVRAYSESFNTRHDLLKKYYLSIFELEKVTATALTRN